MTDAVPRNDAIINGGGTLAGGSYETVTINGGGQITGDLIATTLRINGGCTCQGTVRAGTVAVSGAGTFVGSVQAGEMTVNGSARLDGALGVGRLVVKGNATASGGIAAREVELKGVLKTPRDITAERFVGEGAIEAASLVSDLLDIATYGPSKLGAVRCGRIVVREPGPFAEFFALFTSPSFTAETIHADEAWLANTVAHLVSARIVTLAAGSRVGRVEYRETYSPSDRAAVTEVRQVAE